ncbi:metallophosphoesterase family protein [Pseudomonas sp. JS3066]|uniref:metallophosphoesterase family protein n=1 Tax=unclassified Pseudomonas TaxID=196821 RepID=UPI00129E076F|nr:MULTISPECIES: metallophosphoesterase family protein [unclassified Pseudomonas]MDH4653319.1 metallophosphoesterase family protein [Pseudomonas sp. BN606]MRK20960.1 metallophosphoesterase family protein [Pseudomonas sp. JG-B]WVK93338.1 metallophosphoesterase family protein [Pseudomonas sp. JS3066]
MKPLRIGLISDTHGLLRPQALAALEGCDHILHAGDIGKAEILDTLSGLAPLTAVRGNNDEGPWAQAIRKVEAVQLGGIGIYLVHDQADIPDDLAQRGFRVVVTGHSHKPLINEHSGLLHVNPGSAGPRRFKLPVSVGFLLIDDDARAELRELVL